MLKELYDRIQETSAIQALHIGSKDYTTGRVHLVEDPIYKPTLFDVNTLKGIVYMIKTEIDKIPEQPLILHIDDYNRVEVYTTYSNSIIN